MIVFGHRLFGKVDIVPELFHVATKFVHVWYVPIIPFGSHVIVHEDSEGWAGPEIGLSFKSVGVAWLRGAAILGAIIFAILALTGEGGGYWLRSGICVATFVITKWAKIFTHASPARARELAEKVGGVNAFGEIMLALHCGDIDGEEAINRLEELRDQEEDDE